MYTETEAMAGLPLPSRAHTVHTELPVSEHTLNFLKQAPLEGGIPNVQIGLAPQEVEISHTDRS